jgi:hypothetical protein
MNIEERFLDGTVRVTRGVKFKNPTDRAVKFVGRDAIVREMQVPVGRQRDGSPKLASRAFEVNVPAGGEQVVPAEVANVLQVSLCVDCGTPFRFGEPGVARGRPVCTDVSHHRMLTSGLAPQLVLVGDDGEPVPAEKHPNLEAEPSPTFDANDLHARTLARLARGGAK